MADVDLGLKFLHQAFGLEALHFGLFEDGLSHDVAGVREAQKAYTRTLVGLVPEDARTVLDVGCGVGGTSRALLARGFAAEGLSPDPYHQESFAKTCGGAVPFHLTTFEGFTPGRTYDCLLFSESPQYIDKDRFFPKACELSSSGGSIVLADFFKREPNEFYPDSFWVDDFVRKAGASGWRVDYHRDITKEVLPSLEVSRTFMVYGQRLYSVVTDAARRKSPVLSKLASLFVGRKLRAVRRLLFENLPRRLDSDEFERTMRYAMYRLLRD